MKKKEIVKQLKVFNPIWYSQHGCYLDEEGDFDSLVEYAKQTNDIFVALNEYSLFVYNITLSENILFHIREKQKEY